MSGSSDGEGDAYKSVYRRFNDPLSRKLREEAYGEDIGQHSWVTADELRADITRLCIRAEHRVLDLGCGPGGPLTFVVRATGCSGVGLDVSDEAVEAARVRAFEAGVGSRITFHQADLDKTIDAKGPFDAAFSLDVVLHLRNRLKCFRDVARLLKPGGRFLFTDASVLTAPISNAEFALRSGHGHTQIVPDGYNEEALAAAGLRVMEREDRTASALKNAEGRLRARLSHRAEIEALEGTAAFEQQQRYLECVAALSARRALSRIMYLTEV